MRWRQNKCYLRGTAEVIVIDLFYRLEVDHTLQLGLVFVCGEEGEKKKQHLFVLLKYIDNDRLFLARRAGDNDREELKKKKLWSWPIYGLWWWMEKDNHSTFFPPLFFKPMGLSLYFHTWLHSYATLVHHCSLFHQPLQNCSKEPVGNSTPVLYLQAQTLHKPT